jgi:hypothetical protein
MRGYSGIHLPLSACIHFVRNDEIDNGLHEMVSALKKNEIVCAYVDYAPGANAVSLANYIANILELDHQPYGPRPWVPFLDDLISESFRLNGLVIVVDNADVLMETARNDVFDLIEAFLIQFHHWFENKKPCHLCFQMERTHSLGKFFPSE